MNKPITALASETDRALDDINADEFGFVEIAKKLAPSLADASASDGMVIGIEGPWGSGKTSLLNFLRQELPKLARSEVHVITLAPWLAGDTTSLIGSLTDAIAEILEAQADIQQPTSWFGLGKRKASEYGQVLRGYGARTGRTLAPLATAAGALYAPAAVVGAGLGMGAEYLDKLGRKPTDAEVKKRISEQLAELDQRFLVFIDDLDRLEPQQAVEVIRMVRSVADFPKVAYVMCYDRSVLAHALEKGLQVKDGEVFLQKIVQLTFSIPLPEPFDLRLSLLNRVFAIYHEVNGREPDGEEAADIRSAIDHEGSGLRTPRDVKLVLNAIKFAYRNMAQELNFADLCRISLIKILQPALYRWLENYLSVRSVIFTGDARVSDDDIDEIGTQLRVLLPSDTIGSHRSIWNLSNFIPGLQYHEDVKKCVFQPVYDRHTHDYIRKRRLGSPLHYRYYFALSGPRTALPDSKMAELLDLAKNDRLALAQKLREYVDAPRPLGQNWFEYILDRLNSSYIGTFETSQIRGVGLAITDVMDYAIGKTGAASLFRRSVADKAELVLGDIIDVLRKRDANGVEPLLDEIFDHGPSLSWLVGEFFRSELFDHGIVGDRAKPQDMRHLTSEELTKYREVLKQRLTQAAEDQTLPTYPELSGILYGWRDLAGVEAPREWVQSYIADDDKFIDLLLEMRGLAVSDKVYYPLRKSAVEYFLDWEAAVARLEALEAADPSRERSRRLADIREAMRVDEDRF